MLAGMNPSREERTEMYFDYLSCRGSFWDPKHVMMGKYDRYTAYIDLLPIRMSDQNKVDRIDRHLRARLLEITQQQIEKLRPRLIIVINQKSLYYWGSNEDATWMGYRLGTPIRKVKDKWNLYQIQGLKSDKPDRINKELFNDYRTQLRGSYLLQYRQVTRWRHPKLEDTICEKDIESLLKEIDPKWEKTLY